MKPLIYSSCLASLVAVQSVSACDLCAIYAASESRGDLGKGLIIGVAEQFTHFGTLQEEGVIVPNEVNQSLDSSITQLLLGYNFTERFGVQFNLPLIHRSFRRPENGTIESGIVSGLGDVSLTAHAQLLRHETKNATFTWNLLGGVKFPTGDTSRLAEEMNETEPAPGEPVSGIHGHDLTLGSGSWDGVVGTSAFLRWKRCFLAASLQYAIRTRGDFDYEFANDLTWSGGPGVLLALSDKFTLSLQANVSGETKGRDTFQGALAEDTGITAVYLGPEIVLTWRDKLSVEFGTDLPVSIDNTALQIVPDWRVRGALTWHF